MHANNTTNLYSGCAGEGPSCAPRGNYAGSGNTVRRIYKKLTENRDRIVSQRSHRRDFASLAALSCAWAMLSSTKRHQHPVARRCRQGNKLTVEIEQPVVWHGYNVLVQTRCIDHISNNVLQGRSAEETHIHLKLVLEARHQRSSTSNAFTQTSLTFKIWRTFSAPSWP